MCLFVYSLISFLKSEFSWQCCKFNNINVIRFLAIVVGNIWAIAVTGGGAFVAFYSAILIIKQAVPEAQQQETTAESGSKSNSNNSSMSETVSKKATTLNVPMVDPGFLMNEDLQRLAMMWLPAIYFGLNVLATFITKKCLM